MGSIWDFLLMFVSFLFCFILLQMIQDWESIIRCPSVSLEFSSWDIWPSAFGGECKNGKHKYPQKWSKHLIRESVEKNIGTYWYWGWDDKACTEWLMCKLSACAMRGQTWTLVSLPVMILNIRAPVFLQGVFSHLTHSPLGAPLARSGCKICSDLMDSSHPSHWASDRLRNGLKGNEC